MAKLFHHKYPVGPVPIVPQLPFPSAHSTTKRIKTLHAQCRNPTLGAETFFSLDVAKKETLFFTIRRQGREHKSPGIINIRANLDGIYPEPNA